MAKTLFKSTAVIAFMTLLSRIFGLVREVVFASIFGAGAQMDAFLVAFKIPNIFRRLFAEGALTQAFVPVFAEEEKRADLESTRDLLAKVLGLLILILGSLICIGLFFKKELILLFAPGFSQYPEQQKLASDILQWTLPYLFFISLTALGAAVLNTKGRFAVPAFTPVLLNICMILGTLYGGQFVGEPLKALAIAVLVGGICQWLFQVPSLRRIKMWVRPKLDYSDRRVRRIFVLMGPIIFSGSMAQLGLLINTIFASYLVAGSISWIYYADRLMELPLGLLGSTMATVMLPKLSSLNQESSLEEFTTVLQWAMRCLFIVCIPATLGMLSLSFPIVTTLYHRGEFNVMDALMTHQALMAYSLGLSFFISARVLVTAFYARQNTRSPMRYAMMALLLNVLLNMALIKPLGHLGLVLATSISSMLNVTLLTRGLKHSGICILTSDMFGFLVRVLLSAFIMGGVLHYCAGNQPLWTHYSELSRVMRLSGLITLGLGTYFLCLYCLNVPIRGTLRDPKGVV